jgi:hypothetical protein
MVVGPPEELTCAELVELVTDYLEGSLASRDRFRFEEHLTVCDGCVVYLEQMRKAIALTGMLNQDDIAPEAQAALLETFRGWRDS